MSPLGVGLDLIPSISPLGLGLDLIPLNFPLGCGPGSDSPPIPSMGVDLDGGGSPCLGWGLPGSGSLPGRGGLPGIFLLAVSAIQCTVYSVSCVANLSTGFV